jgi:hypothetical protein
MTYMKGTLFHDVLSEAQSCAGSVAQITKSFPAPLSPQAANSAP